MGRSTGTAGPFRTTVLAGGLLLIVFEAVAFVVIQPATAFSIALGEIYRTMNLGGVMALVLLGAALSLVPLGIGYRLARPASWAHPSRARRLWARTNGLTAVVGTIALVSLLWEAMMSFGYIGLYDEHPDLVRGPLWLFGGNFVIASTFLGLAAISSIIYVIRIRPRRQS
jgi:hypothetical protein